MKCFSLDVECAKGLDNRLVPISIALVDHNENVLIDTLVKPGMEVVDYLTSIHGIRPEDLEKAPELSSCLGDLRKILGNEALLVGQSIDKDIEYLQLIKGTDFVDCVDVALFFALIPHQSISDNVPISPRRFTLEQTVRCLLMEQSYQAHNPVEDARFAMRLYLKYKDSPKDREIAKSILRSKICPEKFVPSGPQRPNPSSKKNPKESPLSLRSSNSSPTVHYSPSPRSSPVRPYTNMQPAAANNRRSPRSPIQFPSPYMPPNMSFSPLPIQFKIITLHGTLSDITTFVKIMGRPKTKHIITFHSPTEIILDKTAHLESIEFFHFSKMSDRLHQVDGFFEGAFQGTVDVIQRAIDGTKFKASPLDLTQTTICVTLYFVPLEAYVFCDNEGKSIINTAINPPGMDDTFAEMINRLINEHPDLRPTKKFADLPLNKSEWDHWLDLLEIKLKSIEEARPKSSVSLPSSPLGILPTPTAPLTSHIKNPRFRSQNLYISQPSVYPSVPVYSIPTFHAVNATIPIYLPSPHSSISFYPNSRHHQPKKLQYQPVSSSS